MMMLTAATLLGISIWYIQRSHNQWYIEKRYYYEYGWPIWSRLVDTSKEPIMSPKTTANTTVGWEYSSISYTYILNPCINFAMVAIVDMSCELFTRRKNRES